MKIILTSIFIFFLLSKESILAQNTYQQYDSLIVLLNKQLPLAEDTQKINMLQLASKLYAKQRNFDKAYIFNQMYIQLRDSLTQVQVHQSKVIIQQLKNQLKEEQQLSKFKDQIIQKGGKQISYFWQSYLWLAVVLISLFAFWQYRNSNHKKQLNLILETKNSAIQEQKSILENKNEELIKKNQEIEAKNQSFEILFKELNDNSMRLNDSLRYAEKIQRAILPYEWQFKEYFADHFVIFKPKDLVSGDFYWLAKNENKIFLAIVDCTGHGVPGAFMSMIGNTLLNEIINQEKIDAPNEILSKLNQGVRLALKQKDSTNSDGMDLALCCIEATDEHNFQVQFSGAKSSVYYFSDNQLTEIRGDRKSIGGWQKETEKIFTNVDFSLKKGDLMYFSTDGYTDASDKQRKKIGYKRFQEILATNTHLSLKEQGAALLEVLYTHQGQTEQRDDVTLVGIKL